MLIPMSDRNINRFKVLQDVGERRLRNISHAFTNPVIAETV
ncbi:hypothetical protein [Vibrio tubiashii]|nr:hypothetical protein [Vibrio tubiashii]